MLLLNPIEYFYNLIMKMKIFFFLFLMMLMLLSSTSLAAIQMIKAEGSYQMGENDSIAYAKEGAKNDALRYAAEQAGVFIRAYSKTKNFQMTDDEIEVVAANVMKIKKCEYEQEYLNNTLVFHAHVVVTVDDSKFDSIIKHEKKRLELEEALEKEKERNKDIKNLQIQHGTKDISTETELLMNSVLISKAEYTKALFNLSGMIKTRDGIVPARAYYLRSIVYFNTEKYNEALSDIGKAIAIDGNNPLYYVHEALIRLAISQLYVSWGQQSQAKSQYFLAETKCDTALTFKRNYWPALYCRSISRYLRDTIRKSVDDSESAIKHGGRGISYVENFNAYINAQYKGRHKHMAKQNVIDFLKEGVNGLMDIKGLKK